MNPRLFETPAIRHFLDLQTRVGLIERVQFAASLSGRGWTNRREFRLPETEGGGEDLCSRAITLTTA